MNEQEHSLNSPLDSGPSHRRSFWLPLLGAGLLVVSGATIYQGVQNGDLHTQFTASQQETAALRAQLNESDSELQSTLTALREQMDRTQKETSASLAKTQSVATRHADVVAGKIAQKQEQQEQQAQQLAEELGKVKESATETSASLSANLDGISSKVGSVRTDVDSAKSDIEQTKSELQRARGDMGEMSGLIATNSHQIQMLRDLGDRNIFTFTLAKAAGLQKVGDIQVVLTKADMKRNRFTMAVLADDKRVEKKDRTINEPVQFYTSKASQPYELVINQVSKDQVTGYLATPKVTSARNTTPASAR